MANPEWEALRFQQIIPGAIFAVKLDEVTGPIVGFLQSVADFLDLIKSFLFEFGNPIEALVNTLLQELIALIESLRQIGLFALFLFPDFQKDPELTQIRGGYEAFKQRICSSLTDTEDPNRPQFGAGDTMGGVVLAFDAQNVGELSRIIKRIEGFFNRAKQAQPAAPINLGAQPADSEGDALDPSEVVAGSDIGGALLTWSIPGLLTPFTTPKFFLIERSTLKSGTLQKTNVPLDTVTNLTEEGLQQLVIPVKQQGVQDTEWQTIAQIDTDAAAVQGNIPTPDEFGLLHFPQDIIGSAVGDVDRLSKWVTAVLPEQSFYFFDNTAEKGNTYYYRVRSLYEDKPKRIVKNEVVEGPLVSEPCAPATVAIPEEPTKLPEDVSLRDAMLDLYRAAYVLQFYRTTTELTAAGVSPIPVGTETMTEIDGRQLFSYLDVLEDRGVPLDLVVTDVFTTISDWLKRFSNRVAVRLGRRPQTARLYTEIYAQHRDLLLELWSEFQSEVDTSDIKSFVANPPQVSSDTEANRIVVLNIVNLVKRLGDFPGTPPNWESVRLIEDFLPFVDQYLNASIEFLKGLLTGGQGIIRDLADYIEFLNRKVDFLVQFLEDIEILLEFTVTTDFGVYLLNIPPEVGGVNYFTNALLTAELAPAKNIIEEIFDSDGVLIPPGTESVPPGPAGGPSDYTSGLVLAYGITSAQLATGGATQGQFELTRAAMDLVFGG